MNRYNGAQVTPLDDARLNQIVYVENGILVGCALSHLGANQVRIEAGTGILKGRDYEVAQETLLVQLATSGTMPGRIYIKCDLANTVTPIQILSVCASTLPALVQNPNFNEVNGIWEEELATYTASTTAISGLTTKFKRLTSVVTPYITTSKTETVPGKTIDATVLSEIFTTYLTANLTLYVATTGNDTTGTGTSGNPYATISKVLSVVPKNLNGYDVTIVVSNGTYTEDITASGFHGGTIIISRSDVATIVINGTVTNLTSTQISFSFASGSTVTINKNGNGIVGQNNSYTRFLGATYIVNATGTGVAANRNSTVLFEGVLQINNSAVAIDAVNDGKVYVENLSGTGNVIGLRPQNGGEIGYGTNTISATTPTQKIDGGIITNELANKILTEVTLASTSWTLSGGVYYQTVTLTGATSSTVAYWSMKIAGNTSTSTEDINNSYINNVVYGTNTVTFWAKAIPSANMTIKIVGV